MVGVLFCTNRLHLRAFRREQSSTRRVLGSFRNSILRASGYIFSRYGGHTESSAASDLSPSRLIASGSRFLTSPSLGPLPVRNDCITLCFVNFQYPVVAPGCCGCGAV